MDLIFRALLKSVFIFLVSFQIFSQTQFTLNSNQSVSNCNAFIIDAGGIGGSGYSNNENYVFTICPDQPNKKITLAFNTFSLDLTDDNLSPTITDVDTMYVYDGDNTSATLIGAYTGTSLFGVNITATNTLGCMTIKFSSNSIGTGMFGISASCLRPCSFPTAAAKIVNGITDDSIRVCVGSSVTFEDNGSFAIPGLNIESYTWDFMDGTTSTGTTISHVFNTPGLYKVQLNVKDNNPDNTCLNQNLTDLQVLVGTIPSFTNFPNDTTLCLGESIVLSTSPNLYNVTWNGFPNSTSVDNGCLTDNQIGIAQNINLIQTAFLTGSTITNVNQIQSICFDLEHSFMGDLIISVFCPNGQSMILHQQGGGGTDLGNPNTDADVDCNDPSTIGVGGSYCFTPTATDTWVDWVNNQGGFATALPSGGYKPIQPFSNLVGCPTNGNWRISVVDNWGGDDGTLFTFALNLDPALLTPVTSFEPQIGLGSDSSFWNMPASFVTNLSTDGDVLSVTPLNSGNYNYQYTVLDNFGCSFDTIVKITVNADPTVFAGNDTILCENSLLQLNGLVNGQGANSTCDYTINFVDDFGDGWNGNTITIAYNGTSSSFGMTTGLTQTQLITVPTGTNVTATFNANGSFLSECSYTITDENGVVVVDQSNSLSGVVTNQFIASCAGNFIYSWTLANLVSDPTILDPQVNSFAGQQNLILNTYPVGHPLCTVSDTISIDFIPTPNAGLDTIVAICEGAVPFDLFSLLRNADANGVWKNQLGNVISMPFDPMVNGAGIYKYLVSNTTCLDSSIVTINLINSEITNQVISNVSCNSLNNGTVNITGINFSSYVLNNGAPINNITSPFTINNLAPGNYTILLSGSIGCSTTSTFSITEPTPLQITTISNDTIICPGFSASLFCNGTGGSSTYTYSWLENGIPIGSNNPIIVSPVVSPTNYCVILSEACGSPNDTLCMRIDLSPEIVPALIPDKVNGCLPLDVSFENNSSNINDIQQIIVDFGDGEVISYTPSNFIDHQYKSEGTYSVKVKIVSKYGCDYNVNYTNLIEVFSLPEASFIINPNPTSMYNPYVDLLNTSSSDVINYSWFIPEGTPAISTSESVNVKYPETVSTYPVTLYVTNDNNCVDSVTNYVIVNNEVLFYAPNSFTPDGDEFNQVWKITIAGIDIEGFILSIYNRWGELIWESRDPSISWDGTFNGQKVPLGTYNWTLQAGDEQNDERYFFNGYVNVIK